MVLANQGRVENVSLRLLDRGLQETIWEYAFTPEDIARGEFTLSGYDLYAGEFAQQHMDLLRQGYAFDPVLEVAYSVASPDGAETQSFQAEPAPELWVSARYDLVNPQDDFLNYFMEQTTYPDSFVVRIDPIPVEGIRIVYDESSPLSPGDVSVRLFVNGQEMTADAGHLEVEPLTYDGESFYAYAFVLPRPDSWPDHGTATIEITQKLLHYDSTYTKTLTVEY